MLTLKKLEKMKPGIFAQGEVKDNPQGINIADTGKVLKWVAVRGTIEDWAIYIDNPYDPRSDFQNVADYGDKIHNLDYIQKLVPCDKEALEMYRH